MTWLIAIIALIGVFLNVQGKWQGFLFWLISNAYWCWHNLTIGEYPQAVLFAMFFLLSAYGVKLWRKPQKPSQNVINFCKRILGLKDIKIMERRKVNWLFEEANKILCGGNGEVGHKCK